MAYCKHRWVNQKRWTEMSVDEPKRPMLCVIQKCRYCNAWQRIDVEMLKMKGRVTHCDMDKSDAA